MAKNVFNLPLNTRSQDSLEDFKAVRHVYFKKNFKNDHEIMSRCIQLEVELLKYMVAARDISSVDVMSW